VPGGRLLGRHVERRAHHRVRARDGEAAALVVAAEDLRDAEVHELDHLRALLGSVEVDVLRLQVPVDDPRRVRLVERPRDLLQDLERVSGRERAPPLEARPEVLAVEELHDHEGRTVELRGDVGVGDAHDVVARDLGGGARLTAEALHVRGVEVGGPEEDLERPGPSRVDVLAHVHRPHSAAPDEAEDAVPTADQGS